MTRRGPLPRLAAPVITATRFFASEPSKNIPPQQLLDSSESQIYSSESQIYSSESQLPCMRVCVRWLSPLITAQFMDVEVKYTLEVQPSSSNEWSVVYEGPQLSIELPQVILF